LSTSLAKYNSGAGDPDLFCESGIDQPWQGLEMSQMVGF